MNVPQPAEPMPIYLHGIQLRFFYKLLLNSFDIKESKYKNKTDGSQYQ